MANSQKNRQKKLAAKKAKRKIRLKSSQEPEVRNEELIAIKRCAKNPIHECFVSDSIKQNGMGTVVLSRLSQDQGFVGLALILVDSYCLGVKNCVFKHLSMSEYRKILASASKNETLQPAQPEKALKIIQGAIAYARAIGFSPCKDYRNIPLLFADVDASVCEQEFEFGCYGKPFFIQGPNDSPTRISHVVGMLKAKLGEDGFHFRLEAGLKG